MTICLRHASTLVAALALSMIHTSPAAASPPALQQLPPVPVAPTPRGVPHGAVVVEQTVQGTASAARLVVSFDGLGAGFSGPEGTAALRNPSDNSIAVGRDQIIQTVNSRLAIFTRRGAKYDSTGVVLLGPVPTNQLFRGFGGACETHNNGDAVVRYDQLADRWLLVMPIFRRVPWRSAPPAGTPSDSGRYAMCYAVSATSDALGSWHRYEFDRPLFPDYPRPAVWPDGYYTPTSTGDDVIEKHVCVVDRRRMLAGEPATEQCILVPDVNFLNTSDLDGRRLPPPGAPNIVIAAGGSQLKGIIDASELQVWKFYVDWETPGGTRLDGPQRIEVAPYRYLCGGQLTSCVSQPGTDRRLDAQGDKLMARLVYRRFRTHEALVAVHSVNTSAGGGGVRWYELRVGSARDLTLYQQGTYAPDSLFRWMASPALDHLGNIGIGYSYGGAPEFPGQRFAGRTPDAPLGLLSLRETVLAQGEASQTTTLRWEDYTQTAIDPLDDCTVWYVGDYLRAGAMAYSTRIGAFRMPGCT